VDPGAAKRAHYWDFRRTRPGSGKRSGNLNTSELSKVFLGSFSISSCRSSKIIEISVNWISFILKVLR